MIKQEVEDSGVVESSSQDIAKLLRRIDEIENELSTLGAVYKDGRYQLDDQKFLDKSWFEASIAQMKNVRAAGLSLGHHMFVPLRHRKPVDLEMLHARIKTLYDEECDCLIALCEYELAGVPIPRTRNHGLALDPCWDGFG